MAVDCGPLPASRPAPSRAMADLQRVHAPRVQDGTYRLDRGADAGPGHQSDAADPAHQARVAGGRARGGWRTGAAPELSQAVSDLLFQADKTVRPTTRPARKSSSAACAC